jgi:hypothetical protein
MNKTKQNKKIFIWEMKSYQFKGKNGKGNWIYSHLFIARFSTPLPRLPANSFE